MTVVVTFLGVLEMIKAGILRVSQEETDGDIMMTLVRGTDLSLLGEDIYEEESEGNGA